MKSQKTTRPGLFITFEGPEGAGKSTQLALLADELESRGFRVVRTREPGGTALAEQIREIVKHDCSGEKITPAAELLLFSAARNLHVENLIRPALERGDVVLCDRFADSTAAYQGAGGGVDAAEVGQVRHIAVAGCEPDLTIILDLPVETGFDRVAKRETGEASYDRFESRNRAFHQQIRQSFLDLARREPERVKVVSADADRDEVQRQIRRFVDASL